MNINSLKIFGLLIIILTTVILACDPDPPTPTPTPAPCQDVSREPRRLESTEPFVHLYAPKVNVTAGEQFSLNLAALNPIGTGGNLDITFILTVPSGISIDGSDFGTSVQGFTHNTVTLNTGESREIGIHMSAGAPPIDQQVENHRITGQVSWRVEGSNQSFNDCYELDITVSHNPVELAIEPGEARTFRFKVSAVSAGNYPLTGNAQYWPEGSKSGAASLSVNSSFSVVD